MDYNELQAGDLAGFSPIRRQHRMMAVASAAALLADVMSGRVPSYILHEAIMPQTMAVVRAIDSNYPGIMRISEAMTTSDFPNLTGDILDRMMLARYREFPSPWRQFARVVTNLRDFRQVKRIAADGMEGRWEPVPEMAEFERGALTETPYLYAPLKYARGAALSFEAIRNDDLMAFETIPDRLGRGGARTQAHFATSLYVDANGPHASFYTGGNGNILAGNPALSITSLGAAWTVLRSQVDTEGEPIMVEAAVLTVPPSLEVTARNILQAVQVFMTNTGGASGQEMQVANWIGSNLTLAVDPYIPIIASNANGGTSWFLFANPSVGRPALEVGSVSGFAEPQMYQKLANTVRLGGAVDQMAGDWDTMSQEYKGVVSVGGARLDPKSTVGSNGSGS